MRQCSFVEQRWQQWRRALAGHGRLGEERLCEGEVWGKSAQECESCCKGGEGGTLKRVYDKIQEEAVVRQMGEAEVPRLAAG